MSSIVSIQNLNQEQLERELLDYYNKYYATLEIKTTEKKGDKKKEPKLKKVLVSATETIAGEQFFYINKDDNSLIMSIVNKPSKQTYTEAIYLPYIFNLNSVIQTVNNRYQEINTVLIEELEYETVETNVETVAELKVLHNLLASLHKLKSNIVQEQLIQKNSLIEQEGKILRNDKVLYDKIYQDIENIDAIESYLTHHSRVMTTVNHLNQPVIVKGIQGLLNNELITIVNPHKDISTFEIKDSVGNIRSVPKGPIIIVEGIRNQIRKQKAPTLNVSVDKIIEAISHNPMAVQLFLQMFLNRDTKEGLVNRPRKEVYKESGISIIKRLQNKIIYEDKTFVFYVNIGLIYDDEDYQIIKKSRHASDCINSLRLSDSSTPFHVEDFTFLSPLHYQKACQFYNRTDLFPELRREYNDFFMKFTQEYDGADSMYNMSLSDIQEILSMSSFQQPYDWNSSIEGQPSKSSIYLRKALYKKINSNQAMKECLLGTNMAKLYEKLGRGKYRVANELMEVRYYIRNSITPPYLRYNYSEEVKAQFNQRIAKTEEDKNMPIVRVLLELDSYTKRAQNLNNPNPLADIVEFYKEKEPLKTVDIEFIQKILYSYLGQYMYETVKADKTSSPEIILKKNPEFANDNLNLFAAIYTFARLEDKMIIRQLATKAEQDKNIAKANIDKQEKLITNNKKFLESRVRLLKYIGNPWLNGRIDSLYTAVVNNMIIQNKYPFNFKNTLDNRNKYPEASVREGRSLVYEDAAGELLNAIVNLYKVYRPDDAEKANAILDRSNQDTILEVELLSRYLGADITIIDSHTIKEISYLDTRSKIGVIIPEMVDYVYPHVHIVLVLLSKDLGIADYDQFTDAVPDPSKKDKIIEYLYEPNSGMLLKENEDQSQKYIGIWDPIELVIDKERDMPEIAEDAEIQMEILRFYKIDGRKYYEMTELM